MAPRFHTSAPGAAALAAALPFLLAALPGAALAQSAPAVDPALYAGMTYRMVGPFRGGRVTAVTGVPGELHTFLMGASGGGVWRTDDAGGHWTPIADDALAAGAVGAIAVAPSDANVIYVGTGSACIRGNVSVGRGVWKSVDGGDRWSFVGLPESGAVGEIVVHPEDPDLVYVAALGHPFGPNPERGVYRSKDGGATWENVLFLSDSTGAVSLAMNPENPREIYAGMWRAERKPWALISGSEEGGLYKSVDGGDHWTKLAGGLPEGLVGKTTVTVSPARPDRVWAMVEAEPGNGLYRSDDAGATWTFLTGEDRLAARPFYYHHVVADPVDPNTVFVLNTRLYRSTDGGERFDLIPVPHGDVHDVWISPVDPRVFVVGDDGGAVVTLNNGGTFSSMYNQPTGEFYDVVVDNQTPYRLYGSQQDNTTISVPVTRQGNTLRPQQEWAYAAGCETGPVSLHPDHPEVVWGGCYGGVINRLDVPRDVRRNMNLYPASTGVAPADLRYRFQWVAPIVVSPHDAETVYHASQYVHRTRDGGTTWETISPDLTTDDPETQRFPGGPIHADNTGVEVYNTIFALTVSPHDAGTIWVGSDDGLVHLTRDDGATWTDVTPPGLPKYATINRIEVSPHAPGRIFLAVQRYRMDDWRPYVFRTDDFARSWTSLTDGTNGIPADHWVRVVREDPERRGLLYAGTEFGLYVSFDDGGRWQPLQLNLPVTPVTDLKVHRGDLVVATQGRAFWVLDDVTPLRALAADPTVADARLYTPRDAARGASAPPLQEVDLILPDERPDGALIGYAVARELAGLTLEVVDARGTVTARWRPTDRRRPLPDEPGFHRVAWDLRYTERGGVKAPPGTYTARLTWDGGSAERAFRVLPNPRDPGVTQADYDAQFRVASEVFDSASAVGDAVVWLRDVRGQAQAIVARAREADRETGALPELARALGAALDTLEAALTSHDVRDAWTAPHSEVGLDRQFGTLLGAFNGGGGYGPGAVDGAPTPGQLERKADLDRAWRELHQRVDAVRADELAAFNAEVERLGLAGVISGARTSPGPRRPPR